MRDINKPKLRFKEFNDEWQNKKITDFLNRVSKQSNNDDLPRVEYENIKSGFGKLIMKPENNHKNGILFNENDILFGKLRPYLNNYLKPKFNGVAVGDFWVFRPKKNVNSMFVYDLIQSERYQKVANYSAGSKMPRSDWNLVSSVDFKIPNCYEEQRQIGLFFDKLDNLIDLKSSKIASLERFKRGYIQKLFTNLTEHKPKLRFKGFNDNWEKIKLKELGTVLAGGDVDKSKLKNKGRYPVIANNLKNNGIVGYYEDDYKVDYPSVTVSGRGNVGHAVARKYKYTPVVRVLVFKTNQDVKFMEISINEINFFNESTGVPQLTSPQFLNYKVSLPTKKEQSKIANLMTLIDKKINLQQKELDRLKSLKKGYLQKMFV